MIFFYSTLSTASNCELKGGDINYCWKEGERGVNYHCKGLTYHGEWLTYYVGEFFYPDSYS